MDRNLIGSCTSIDLKQMKMEQLRQDIIHPLLILLSYIFCLVLSKSYSNMLILVSTWTNKNALKVTQIFLNPKKQVDPILAF